MIGANIKKKVGYEIIDYLLKDPDNNMEKGMKKIDAFVPAHLFKEQRKAFRGAIERKDNWYQLMNKILKMNPEVMSDLLKTFVMDANILAWDKQEKLRDKYDCNIPWAILLDPTSACNLHCKGCWAADYGNSMNLSFETIDSIIEQGKELGVHVYIYTGGEPLVRKHDLIKLCEKHSDCAFLCFTNATLIDEEFCQEMIRVKNFVPAISAEGFEETTDERRGKGTYKKIVTAMDLLAKHELPFGISACYTSQNADSICTEEYWDWMIEKGALFCWIFTYMPVGKDAPTDLMATSEQREKLYRFGREMRKTKALFTLDFWNDAEFVGGCIAGGRRYLHINANGDVEPCVFAHYSNCNIHDTTLLEALQSPLFMQYRQHQPFNDNLMQPCPMLDNPYMLEKMVEKSGAKNTDYTAKESAHEICAKCEAAAKDWDGYAKRIWTDENDERAEYRKREYLGQAKSDINKLEKLKK